ncbi:unnamed protein product [Musa acuminata subsp. malaccensis]|uniref:(wild Malaysian banana) hypothetical protein n=1 Tax=Musa acuminata subsp. malaccensis TaxID=214687 RepID=A0A804JPB2_MUSAM|nr:unnamed protein product [Musa acuminata subsp. malaccensis]
MNQVSRNRTIGLKNEISAPTHQRKFGRCDRVINPVLSTRRTTLSGERASLLVNACRAPVL